MQAAARPLLAEPGWALPPHPSGAQSSILPPIGAHQSPIHLLRVQTLRAYVDMLRMEDRLWGHPTYLKARRALRCPAACCVNGPAAGLSACAGCAAQLAHER